MALPHKGSWGLPDFGLTEKLTDILGYNRTNQGGSDLFYSKNTPTQPNPKSPYASSYPYASSGSVPGTSKTNITPKASSTFSGSGSGGGGGNTNQSVADVGNSLEDAARQRAEAELREALSSYDYNREQLGIQQGAADTQRSNTLNYLSEVLGNIRGEVDTQKGRATTNKEREIGEASDTAKSVTRSNRNILRGLGILNSTAAGELLSSAGNEFGKQRAQIMEATRLRLDDLDNFYNTKLTEHQNAVSQVENQYSQLVQRIQSDLRFNDRQRTDAIRSANAALSERLAEIKTSIANWQMQVNTAKNNLASSVASLNEYSYAGNDLNAIQDETLTAGQQLPSQTAQIYGEEEEEDKGLLSRLFG